MQNAYKEELEAKAKEYIEQNLLKAKEQTNASQKFSGLQNET